MKKYSRIDLEDTIAAISTPLGEGAIGIVRLSGREALKIADAIFKSREGNLPSSFKSFTLHYGHIYEDGAAIDEALLTVMRSPKSYTKEDIVEINCHSGIVSLRKILDLVLKSGARIAEPGEFTKRAFLNGRLDLAQAEAVIDVIRSKTEASLRVAFGQLNGGLSAAVNGIKDELLSVLANVEASIDFPEEDLEIIAQSDIEGRLKKLDEEFEALLRSADAGIILREGFSCVICGKPNVGKSSLLNALLQRDRAIVTHIPGTTRDAIEEYANINGIPFKLIDTAGVAPTEDIVEREGILRSRDHIDRADLVLLVLDGSASLTEEDKILLDDTKERPRILVINKNDLPLKIDPHTLGTDRKVNISAKYADGMDALKDKMQEAVLSGRIVSSEDAVVTNARQKEALKRGREALGRAIRAVDEVLPAELIAIELRDALDSAGEIVGEVVTDDVLDRIFSEFCIGK